MQLYDMTIKEHEEFRRWSFLCRCACGFLYLICLFHNLLFHLLNLQATTTWLKCLCILHYMSIFTFIFFWTALNSWYCTVTLVFFDPTSIGWSCFNLHSLSMYTKKTIGFIRFSVEERQSINLSIHYFPLVPLIRMLK